MKYILMLGLLIAGCQSGSPDSMFQAAENRVKNQNERGCLRRIFGLLFMCVLRGVPGEYE